MNIFEKLNQNIAQKITSAVATMWCAYLFAAIALISLPTAIRSGDTIVIVSWIAQTFLQLVLLSVIMVGQSVQSKSVERKIDETHFASLAEFELAKEAQTVAHQELKELRQISQEMHSLVRDLEKRVSKG
ncbi:unannotated protein [freshwater metagenome]|jgi:hypothetical protein|uniref:Unannotated protein n=1 Tax=freshwater metagenome TaxID=449393 RepID=A0A6J7PM08_9ZZZZ|nr:hypothetical protein [Actinomycetota bacterium]MSW06283.1 hypothetical protein [Actinomycetota bacterium]MSX66748.1 hypothetical protein [Actinomycetota bacterium]MSZ62634.1 hypothetical protein [Actinomycetota bacterium]MTA19751.1 hypothetical protein [Actinomycetota bacterium]